MLTVLAGCTTHVEISVDNPLEDEPSRTPFALPDFSHLEAFPALPPLTPYDAPRPQAPTFAGWEVQPDGHIVRISFSGAETYSFDVSGRVVRVADTSINMDAGDLTSWRISKRELATVLGALDALGVREAVPGDFGSTDTGPGVVILFGQGRVISGDDDRLVSIAREVTEPPERGVRPWVPEKIGFLAGPPDRTGRSPLPPDAPFHPWPLEKGIWELSSGTAPNAYGETRLAVCLTGRDAATVWRTLFTGRNTAWLRVDDGRRWELNATVELPGYERLDSPCG